MKLNTLFVASVCAAALFASCNPKTAEQNQLKYTHTSLADGDAFHFFQVVGGKMVYEADYAASVANSSSSDKDKQLAAKVKEVYTAILPVLDSLATANQVDFPIKGAAKFVEVAADSTHQAAAHTVDYAQHVQHETAVVKDLFERLSHNTNVGLRAFAKENLAKIEEIYTLSGGKADAHAHH